MQPQANNKIILEIDDNNANSLAIQFQAEKIHDSEFFTMLSATAGDIIVNVDQNFYEFGFAYFN